VSVQYPGKPLTTLLIKTCDMTEMDNIRLQTKAATLHHSARHETGLGGKE
jgi:hypothetical protein